MRLLVGVCDVNLTGVRVGNENVCGCRAVGIRPPSILKLSPPLPCRNFHDDCVATVRPASIPD
jgi:hypothetical protein